MIYQNAILEISKKNIISNYNFFNKLNNKNICAVTLKADGTPYSASNIRDNFDDFEKIKADIPEHIDPAQIKEIFDSL